VVSSCTRLLAPLDSSCVQCGFSAEGECTGLHAWIEEAAFERLWLRFGWLMTVHFSTRAPNADYLGFEASPEAIIAATKKAEEVGFDAISVNDHIVVGDDARSVPLDQCL
jgi:hypothetical protein